MREPKFRRPLAALLVPGLFASCFSERSDSITTPTVGDCRIPSNSPAIGSLGVVIAMRDYAFTPVEVRVPAGSRVTWVNCEGENIDPHTTTADAGEWNSDLLTSGGIYSRVFNEPGRYEYHCTPHPFMTGVVIVE